MSDAIRIAALGYIARGWSPTPVAFRTKKPILNDWQHLRITAETAPQYFNGGRMNVGVILGPASHDLVDADMDCVEAIRTAAYYLPQTCVFGRASAPAAHWLYYATGFSFETVTLNFDDPLAGKGDKARLCELRIGGGEKGAQTVFPGSTHEGTGEIIRWESDSRAEPATQAGSDLEARMCRVAASALVARHWPGEGMRHDAALALGGVLGRGGWKRPAIKLFVSAVCAAAGDPEPRNRIEAAIDSAEAIDAGKNVYGLPKLSELLGSKKVVDVVVEWLGLSSFSSSSFFGSGTAPDDDDQSEALPPAFTDEALALEFAALHADDLRYVAAWGKWLRWTGQVWQYDDTLAAFDLARVVCREASAECNNPKIAAAVASAKTVAAVERLAKADRRLAATAEQWDKDIWLLNTPDGIIDLRTGSSRPHKPEDYCTKTTAIAPQGECPIFLRCLDRSMAGDADLISFLQRLFGYALAGSIREHALAFFYGLGANGKSLILSAIAGVMGDYHKTAPIETFTATHTDRHPTDLAGLRGARLVTATETEEGRRWAESRIKMLTGGDPVSARFMRQDFFEYLPQFTLIISGNHKPGLRSVGEAIRRRFNLVPFSVIIPPEDRDKDLGEKLKAEWPGILAWMIEGCMAWQRQGLDPPAAIQTATAAYLEGEDALAAWIDECCIRNPNAWATKAALYSSWKTWADESGEFAGSSKRFGQALEDRGFHPHRATAGRGFHGLSLKPVAGWEKQWRGGW